MTPEYQDLLERVALTEPRGGFSNVSQINLNDADVAIVVAHDPDVMIDSMIPTCWTKHTIEWAFTARNQSEREARLGIVLRTCLLVEAKKLVLHDVQDECLKREKLAESVRSLKGGILNATDRAAFSEARAELLKHKVSPR